jgi:crotonobetainyl-CoA:carnitine CoA-transferase CaiB-like acyl-CoA transferase
LAGIRVVEFATMVAGPFAGHMLGDLGAEVIKVEAPGGDPMRGGQTGVAGIPALFLHVNRHKKSIVLDLKNPDALKIARDLALSADVMLENFKPGVLARLGLDYEDLRKENKGLIYASVSGFGIDGPYVERPAYDQVIQGMAGLMHSQGRGGPPQPIHNIIVDNIAAMTAANAVVTALFHRERSGGVGQRVSISLLNAYAATALPYVLVNDTFVEPARPRMPVGDIHRVIATADGHVIGFMTLQAHFEGMCKAFGRPELIEDPRFKDRMTRVGNTEALWTEFGVAAQHLKTADLVAAAARYGAALGPVNTLDDFLNDPQVAHSKIVFERDDPDLGRVRQINVPAQFELSPGDPDARAPMVAEHTDEILKGIGRSAEQIAAYRATGAVA